MPEVTFRFGRQTVKYDRLRQTRSGKCVCTAWMEPSSWHGNFLVKVTYYLHLVSV